MQGSGGLSGERVLWVGGVMWIGEVWGGEEGRGGPGPWAFSILRYDERGRVVRREIGLKKGVG